MIGVDLDTKNRFRLLKAYFNARQISEPILKETLHGVHMRIPIKTDVATNLEIRALLGDDPIRMNFDEMKISLNCPEAVDTLFFMKIGRDGKVSYEEDFNIMSEPFWSSKKARKP